MKYLEPGMSGANRFPTPDPGSSHGQVPALIGASERGISRCLIPGHIIHTTHIPCPFPPPSCLRPRTLTPNSPKVASLSHRATYPLQCSPTYALPAHRHRHRHRHAAHGTRPAVCAGRCTCGVSLAPLARLAASLHAAVGATSVVAHGRWQMAAGGALG
jgi:hypothetical protein